MCRWGGTPVGRSGWRSPTRPGWLAIEAVCAAEATELRGLPPGPATQAAIACIRREIPRMDVDRFLAPDLEVATNIVAHGALLAAVEATVGSLA